MVKKVAVIAHKGCRDGFASLYAAWKYFGESAYYIQCGHGEGAPDIPAFVKDVFIFDFSFPKDIMEDLDLKYNVELWDHHKTAEEELGHLPYCHFNMKKSGAVLAFERFFPDKKLPKLFKYVQDRDLWNNKLSNHEEIGCFVDSLDMSFDVWNIANIRMRDSFLDVVEEGRILLKYKERQIQLSLADEKVSFALIDGYNVPTVNTFIHMSDIANRLIGLYPCPVGATYFDRADGKRQWSLRSDGSVDVSAIASNYGGGGHFKASGMLTSPTEIEFIENFS